MSKILLVEDNEMNRDMLSRRLQRKGFETVRCRLFGCGHRLHALQRLADQQLQRLE